MMEPEKDVKLPEWMAILDKILKEIKEEQSRV
jgi:hypothetical protein